VVGVSESDAGEALDADGVFDLDGGVELVGFLSEELESIVVGVLSGEGVSALECGEEHLGAAVPVVDVLIFDDSGELDVVVPRKHY
jgi:hypothetical protein